MDITPLVPKGRQVIERYGNGGFVVSGVAYKGNILIMPQGVTVWPVSGIADATPESFAALFENDSPEIVLIGVGQKLSSPETSLRAFFHERNVAADIMDTGAACRTYSVLLAEGRMVATALIAV